jgi:5-methylthioadenosine/S-adenosylhomocysteine deaminase
MGLLVGIGTDSVASNDSLDMVREMKTAALLQKALHADPSRMGAKETLGLATSEAAKALGMGDQLGSIEAFKRADLVAAEINTVRDFPCHDPYAHLVYTLTGSHVSTVILAGEVAVFDGRLVNDPTEEALDTWQETASRVGRELERLKKG